MVRIPAEAHHPETVRVSAALLTSGGHYEFGNKFFSLIGVPFMSKNTFDRNLRNFDKALDGEIRAMLKRNRKAEMSLARANGIFKNGFYEIDVIIDGGYSMQNKCKLMILDSMGFNLN
jgi:hypothetical protein